VESTTKFTLLLRLKEKPSFRWQVVIDKKLIRMLIRFILREVMIKFHLKLKPRVRMFDVFIGFSEIRPKILKNLHLNLSHRHVLLNYK